MNNCRIICEWDVVMGWTYFYKVLEPERATLSISRDKEIWKLGDVAGPNNIPVSDETRSEVERWLRDGQFPIPPLRGTDVIQPLSSPGELAEEARKMDNYVIVQDWDAVRGWLHFYRVLEPERATVSIRYDKTWEIAEIAGLGGSPVSNATRSEVEKWLCKAQSRDEEKVT